MIISLSPTPFDTRTFKVHFRCGPKGTKNGTSGGQIKNLKTLSWKAPFFRLFPHFFALLDNFSNLTISRIASLWGGDEKQAFPFLLHTRVNQDHLHSVIQMPRCETLMLSVWAVSLIFLHDFTFFVMIDYAHFTFSKPFDHFEQPTKWFLACRLGKNPTFSRCFWKAGQFLYQNGGGKYRDLQLPCQFSLLTHFNFDDITRRNFPEISRF